MIKKIILALALALPTLAGAQTLKIGLVDTQTIVEAMPAFNTARTDIDARAKRYDEQYQKMMKDAQVKLEEFQKLPADTPEPLKEQLMKEIQDMDQKLGEFQQMAQQDLQKTQATALAPIYQQVKDAISSVGKEGGYTIIQELGAVLYYGAPAEDITAAVKARLGIK